MFWHVLSFLFSPLIPTITRKVKKIPSEPFWCIYTANCEDKRISPNNRNAFQIMLCHVLSFLFSTLFPATRRKVKKVPAGAIMMHMHGKWWRLAYITKQQKCLPNHVLTCSKLPCFNFISSNRCYRVYARKRGYIRVHTCAKKSRLYFMRGLRASCWS